MSFVMYGEDNSKRIVEADSIEDAFSKFMSQINQWHKDHIRYKIERLYK